MGLSEITDQYKLIRIKKTIFLFFRFGIYIHNTVTLRMAIENCMNYINKNDVENLGR